MRRYRTAVAWAALSMAGAGLLLAVSGCRRTREDELVPSPVGRLWIHIRTPWKEPPKSLGLDFRYAEATIIKLREDGKFEMLDGVVNSGKSEMTISHGDGLNLYEGEWKQTAPATFQVRYQLRSASIAPVGGGSTPEVRVATLIAGMADVNLNGEPFAPATGLDPKKVGALFPGRTP